MNDQARPGSYQEIPPSLEHLFDLDGTVAVVTGASSGLGVRFARVLHGAGAHVILAARRVERLESLVEDLGERATPVKCDVTAEDDRRMLVGCASAISGTVDVLVNNAGIGVQMAAEDEPPEEWNRVIDVNLTSVFALTQLVARGMLEAGTGSIINISSMLALVASAPIPQASYCASKGGVTALTRELACQWATGGVRVNAIAPGWFYSEMTDESMFEDDRSKAFIERNCPMRRGGAAHELDGVMLLLASRAGGYITGQTIPVDGGWTAR